MRNKIVILIGLFLVLLIPAQLHAAGNPEKGLPKVDRLIKDRNYNEAILELTEYMQENPEDFDGAQQRIRRIVKLRVDYNKVAAELLNVLINEPTNDEKKLSMIRYLESLEKNPNVATSQFIADTKAAAQFTFYRAKFEEIMQAGSAFIDAGDYMSAAKKYTEGFELYKLEFDEVADEELLRKVNSDIAAINFDIDLWSSVILPYSQAIRACEVALEAGIMSEIERTISALAVEIERLATVRNRIAQTGWFFEDTFAAMQTGTAIVTENSFLPFAQRFILGRRTSSRFEGILGAFDAQWTLQLEQVSSLIDASIRSYVAQSNTRVSEKDFVQGDELLERSVLLTNAANRLELYRVSFERRDETWLGSDYRERSEHFVRIRGFTQNLITVLSLYKRLDAIESSVNAFTITDSGQALLRNRTSASLSFNALNINALRDISTELQSIRSQLGTASIEPTYLSVYSSWDAQIQQISSSTSLRLYRSSAFLQQEAATAMLTQWTTQYSEGMRLLSGVSSDTENILLYYPNEGLASFSAVRTGVTSDRPLVSAAITDALQAPSTIQADQEYTASVQQMRSVVTEFDRLLQLAVQGSTQANSRILQANLARQESDLRYSQAQSALQRNDFQTARDNLQRARERMNQSLFFQESVALRTQTDTKIEQLGADITRIENESIVREVRSLITSGKNFYYQGNVDQAEQIFLQAQARWSITNIDPNAEVANWLSIINTALSMKTGRIIPVSAPLYPQMSQILSSVTQMYTQGSALLSKGNRSEALVILTDAKDKLRQLQLVYPLNQDAGQLLLRIDQLIDPASFTTFFKQKIDFIRANYRVERQTAYSELLDLYQINPSYPGIRNLLTEVEIYLGIRLPPPDPVALARSTELTRAAQRIYDTNTRSMFQVALDQLDEAIKLNADNQTAVALKDRVQTSLGGQSVAVLSGADEAKYQLAVQELQKGNKITAAALLEQLLQDPKSKNSSKIQDLKKRIDSLL